MELSVSDPSGRTWLVSRRLFRPSRVGRRRRPSVGDRLEAVRFADTDIGEGLVAVVIAIVFVGAALAILEFLPFILFGAEVVLVAAAGSYHALRGRRHVTAESDGDVWSWTVAGPFAATRLLARVVRALESGSELPPGGQLETAEH